MPQIIFRYTPRDLNPGQISRIGLTVRPLVAEAVSTPKHPLTKDEIDWLPQPYYSGTMAPRIGVELRMIGYPDRKEKLRAANCEVIKGFIIDAIIASQGSSAGTVILPDPKEPLLWVQFLDPDGVHV